MSSSSPNRASTSSNQNDDADVPPPTTSTATSNNRRSLAQSASTQNIPHNASTRSLAEMSSRSNNHNNNSNNSNMMESPRSATTQHHHEVIDFLRSQSVAQEDLDAYKKVFDDQLLRNFADIKNFGEDRLASNGVKRGHARRIFAEIERRDRELQQQQQQQRNRMRGRGIPQSVSTANLYGALYDMTPVATPVVGGESHGLFPHVGSAAALDNMTSMIAGNNNNNSNKQFSDPNNDDANNNDNNNNIVVAVNNSPRAKNDPFRTSAVVVPGDFCCGMCCELLFSARTVVCGHTFCQLCLERWVASQQNNPTCPLCRAPLIPKGLAAFELPPVNSLIEGLCQRCFPGRYQRSAKSAEEQRRADEEIRLAYALVRHPADGLLIKILLNTINVSRPLELLFLRLPRREFLPPSFLPSANRIETASISPTPVDGYGFNMTSASLHATIMSALQLEPGHWFLDAGAGTGIVAAWAATLVGPSGTSLALDHDTKAAQLMRRNRVIHDQLLFHPTMPLSGANFSGEVTTLSNKYCLFPNLAAAPIAGRRTQFQNLLLNPSVYETNENITNNIHNNSASPPNLTSKNKNLPIAIQILGIERSSAFLDRFAGGGGKPSSSSSSKKNTNNKNSASNETLGLPGVSPLSPQSQQQLPFGGGGCVVHATVTIGNSATSSRRQCRMIGTVRLVEKTDQFQVLSTAQHQQAKQAAKTRITPTTHPRSYSPLASNNNSNNDVTSAEEIPPVLPQRSSGVRLDFSNNDNTNNSTTTTIQRSLSSSLSDESVLCDITDFNQNNDNNDDQDDEHEEFDKHNNNSSDAAAAATTTKTTTSSSSKNEKFSSKDHHVLFSLREVSVFGSDDAGSVFNFGDSQDVDHERLMRFTFCLTKPIGDLLELVKNEQDNKNNNKSSHSSQIVVDAFGIFVASYLRRSDVVATSKFHLLDGGNVLRQLKKWIEGTWVPSEFKPSKYHCLQTNVYDLAQVLFDENNNNNNTNNNNTNRFIMNETKTKILDLIKPKGNYYSDENDEDNRNNNADDDDQDDSQKMRNDDDEGPRSSSSMMMMGSRTNTALPHDNNNNNNNGFFDRVFLACEPQSEADLKRFQKFLKPGGRMVVPFDSELLLISRSQQQQQQGEEFSRESLSQVGFGTFVVPDYRHHYQQQQQQQRNKNEKNKDHDQHDAADTDDDGEDEPHQEENNNNDSSPAGSPKSGPADVVAKKITDAIEDERSHMRSLHESYRLYSLSAKRNRSIKNSPLLHHSSSPTTTTTTMDPSKMNLASRQRSDNDDDDELNDDENDKNLKNSPFYNTEPKNEPIYLRCCGCKLSDAQWSETIDVEKIWGTAPFSDGKSVCIPRPSTSLEFNNLSKNNNNNEYSASSSQQQQQQQPQVAFLKRARGTSYLAYNVDLCARMSYVSCSQCNTIVGAEFSDEPLLTQPFGPWTGRVLLCRAMLCKKQDIVPSDADISGESVKCNNCENCIALPSWKLRSELELRLRSGGARNRSILAGPEFSGMLFSNVRSGSVRYQGQQPQSNNNSDNNQNNSHSPSSTLKMVSDANLYLGDVHCSKCDHIIGFRILGCKSPFAKSRFAFTLGRVALIPGRVKGMPYGAGGGGVRQPHNLMERIYRAIAQSFGINPTEGTRFILRDASGNATIFDGSTNAGGGGGGAPGNGNLIAWRTINDNEEAEEDDDDEPDAHHDNRSNNDAAPNLEADDDHDGDGERAQRLNFNNSRAAARRRSISSSNPNNTNSSRNDSAERQQLETDDEESIIIPHQNNNNSNNNNSGGGMMTMIRRPQAPTPAGEQRIIHPHQQQHHHQDSSPTQQQQIMTGQALRNINQELAEQLVADFDFEDTAERDDDENNNNNNEEEDYDDNIPPIDDNIHTLHGENTSSSSSDDDHH